VLSVFLNYTKLHRGGTEGHREFCDGKQFLGQSLHILVNVAFHAL